MPPPRLKDAKINWGVAPLPLGPYAKGAGTLLITDSLAVFKGTGVEDKAAEFAKYITSPEIQHEYELQGGAGLTPLRPVAGGRRIRRQGARTGSRSSTASRIGGPEPLFTDYKGFQNVDDRDGAVGRDRQGRAGGCAEEGRCRSRAVQVRPSDREHCILRRNYAVFRLLPRVSASYRTRGA